MRIPLVILITGFLALGYMLSLVPACAEKEPDPTPTRCSLIPPSDPCLAGCGNSLFVGQPCTKGGGECSDHVYPEAQLCTVDFADNTSLAFCTRPCVHDDDCGDAAICVGDDANPQAGKGCFPTSCWDGPLPTPAPTPSPTLPTPTP